MNRYTLPGTTPAKKFDPSQEAYSISQDVAAAEALYAELVEADHAVEEISDVLENLHYLSDTLTKTFYSEESIAALNVSGDLTRLTGCATENITSKIAQEAIGDQIKNAWEALKKFIAKIVDTVANFFAKLFNMASAQAQKIIDTKAADIDFALEKETLTVDQVKNLKSACEGLNTFVAKHVEIKNYVLVSSVKVDDVTNPNASTNQYKNVAEGLNKDISDFVAKSNNILKAEDGKVTIQDSALHREKKTLSAAGWTPSTAVELAQYFLEHKNKSSRLGELMKRLKSFNVQANAIGSGFSMAKMACRAETSAYACYAKCLRAFGKQIKTLNGSNKTNSK